MLYLIDAPSLKKALQVALELDDTAGIQPEMIRDLGKSYHYNAEDASALMDEEISETEYIVRNIIN
jgi:hypothetical protein